MKNRKWLVEKFRIFGILMLKFIITYVLAIIVKVVFIDGILNDFIANITSDKFPEFYVWVAYHKNTFLLICLAIIYGIMIYRFISTKVNELKKMYQSLDTVFDENVSNIELPSSLWMFSDKLNKIKYEYTTNKNKAKDAETKKNDLIMYMAHDLKTPLTSVIGYLSLMNEEEDISGELRKKYTKIALDKSLRVEDLTNQFFEITRYSLKDMPIHKTNIDLSILFDQLIEEFYPMLEERGLTLEVNKPNSLLYVADGDKFARAFGNLLKNAIHYSYENTTIIINITEHEDGVEILFKNSGITIPKHKLERIFDKFYRADESRGSHTGGAGLGLAITKEIIELHGGMIEARSENEEIEFRIKL